MPNPNQSNIPVSKSERQVLDLAKERYEQQHGKGDWGDFLGGLAAGFLVGAGIVAGAHAIANRERAWIMQCPHCQRDVRVLVQGKPPSAEVSNCPYADCGEEFIIQYHT